MDDDTARLDGLAMDAGSGSPSGADPDAPTDPAGFMDRTGQADPTGPVDPTGTAPASFHDFSASTIRGEHRELAEYRGRLVLVVNTATHCGFTPQLEGLEALHRRYREHGFTVLGFPSDQFHQDPGTDADTEAICTSAYDVTFPLFSKVDVNGAGAHPVWIWLRQQRAGVLGDRIAWNFTKFLIGADGQVLRRYAPPVPPRRIARRIDQELGLTTAP